MPMPKDIFDCSPDAVWTLFRWSWDGTTFYAIAQRIGDLSCYPTDIVNSRTLEGETFYETRKCDGELWKSDLMYFPPQKSNMVFVYPKDLKPTAYVYGGEQN